MLTRGFLFIVMNAYLNALKSETDIDKALDFREEITQLSLRLEEEASLAVVLAVDNPGTVRAASVAICRQCRLA